MDKMRVNPFPSLAKIELFARQPGHNLFNRPADGWHTWGLEA